MEDSALTKIGSPRERVAEDGSVHLFLRHENSLSVFREARRLRLCEQGGDVGVETEVVGRAPQPVEMLVEGEGAGGSGGSVVSSVVEGVSNVLDKAKSAIGLS